MIPGMYSRGTIIYIARAEALLKNVWLEVRLGRGCHLRELHSARISPTRLWLAHDSATLGAFAFLHQQLLWLCTTDVTIVVLLWTLHKLLLGYLGTNSGFFHKCISRALARRTVWILLYYATTAVYC